MDEVIKNVRETFKDALKLRLRSDVPIALLFSGGLDSSAIAYQINQMIEDGEIELKKIHAFTFNFPGFENNEWRLVQKNAHLLPHIVCESIHIDLELFKAKLPELMKAQGIPTLSVSHLIHVEALQMIKSKGFTVVLNGQGADEAYGGYFPKDIGYFSLDYLKKLRNFITQVTKLKKKWKFSLKIIFMQMLKAFINKRPGLEARIKLKRLILTKKQKARFSRIKNHESYSLFCLLNQVFNLGFNGIIQYEDMASMLNSIEMRSPFLDYRIVQLGLSLPVNFKMSEWKSKFILREAFQDVIPEEIINSAWKLGYSVPKSKLLTVNLDLNESEIDGFWKSKNLSFTTKKWLE